MVDPRWLISRRALLGGISAAGISTLLFPRSHARAQSAAPPTRLLIVHVPEGMWSGAQRPQAGGTDLGPIFGALQPYQSKINVINNLNMQSRDKGPGGDGHHRGVPHMLTGTEMADENNAGGPSIDQKIAQSIGGSSKFASIQLAVRIVYGDTNSTLIWSGRSRVVKPEQSPYNAYSRIFKDVMPSGPSPSPAPTTPVVNLKRSALDYSLAEVARLRPRLGAPDRERLDTYQASLRDIEKRIAAVEEPGGGGPVPMSCTPPSQGGAVDVKAESNYPKIGDLQMDLAVAAFQCNLTRVASLQWGNSNDQCTYSWLGVNTLGHDMAHNNSNCDPNHAKKLKVFQWYAGRAHYLVNKLASIQEGDGTMLDNTLVLWASEFSDSNGHASNNLTWLLMGNAAGYFTTGKIINAGGKSTNDVLTSIGNAMGLTDNTFGNSAYCDGPLAALR